MPRARSPNSIKAEDIYIENKGNIDLVKIAKLLNISPGTIRSWKNRYKWNDKLNATLQKDKRNVANKKVNKLPPSKEPKLKEELQQLENADLTDKQRLFCIYYIKCFNATKAYQKAYNCSYESALVAGPRMLGNVRVKEEINKLKANKLQDAYFGLDDLIQKHIDIALADMTDYAQFGTKEVLVNQDAVKNGENPVYIDINYVNINDSSEVDGTLISEISEGKNGIKLKLIDKKQSLDFLKQFTGFIDPSTAKKLDIEREKLELLKRKNDDSEDEYEDDGFIEALQGSVKDVWEDEE